MLLGPPYDEFFWSFYFLDLSALGLQQFIYYNSYFPILALVPTLVSSCESWLSEATTLYPPNSPVLRGSDFPCELSYESKKSCWLSVSSVFHLLRGSSNFQASIMSNWKWEYKGLKKIRKAALKFMIQIAVSRFKENWRHLY